eukprot:gene2802-3415_t
MVHPSSNPGNPGTDRFETSDAALGPARALRRHRPGRHKLCGIPRPPAKGTLRSAVPRDSPHVCTSALSCVQSASCPRLVCTPTDHNPDPASSPPASRVPLAVPSPLPVPADSLCYCHC